MPKPDRLIRIEEVAQMTSLAVGTIYQGGADTHELLSIRLGTRCLRFSYNDVVSWIETKKAEAIKQRDIRRIGLLIKPWPFTGEQINRICEQARKRRAG
jgi:predicted DNA-binding transcriptional regulator AlpA